MEGPWRGECGGPRSECLQTDGLPRYFLAKVALTLALALEIGLSY